MTRSAAPRPHRNRHPWFAAALAVLAAANTLVNDFTYDDVPMVQTNPVVIGQAPFLDIWARDYWAPMHGWDPNRDLLYRPLTLTTYRLNYLIGGTNPLGYHAVNVLLHAAVTALVVMVSARIGCAVPLPLLAGILFAVMPIHVEAVAGVVGRAELLAACFTLAAIRMTLPRDPHPFQSPDVIGIPGPVPDPSGLGSVGDRSRQHTKTSFTLLTLLILAALLAKESGLAAVALAPLFAYACCPNPSIRNLKSQISNPHRWLPAIAAILALAIYLPLRYCALGERLVMATVPSPITNMLADSPVGTRFWGAWQLFGLHVAKTFWPAELCMDYSYKSMSLADSLGNAHVLLGLAAFVSLVAGAIVAWKQDRPGLAMVCLAVVIAYLPVSNSFFLMKTLYAERVWYLPSAFAAMVIAAASMRFARRGGADCGAGVSPAREPVTRRRIDVVVVVFIMVAGLARSWVRNAEWRDNDTLFQSAYRVHPTSAPVLYAYGCHLLQRGDESGLALLEQCVRIAPGLTDAQVELGRARLRRGDYAGALQPLQAAAMQQPSYPDVQELLRHATNKVGNDRAAQLERLRQAVRDEPNQLGPLLTLGEALTQSGDVAEALSLFNDAATRFGNDAAFHSANAVALMIAGHRDESIKAYQRSITRDANQPRILAELAMALLDRNSTGDSESAADLLDRAQNLAPGQTQVLLARAELMSLQGNKAGAAEIFRQVIGDQPHGEFRDSLQARLELLVKP